MDVIGSLIEQYPWGLAQQSGFQAEAHIMQYPGNSVGAAGSYWLALVRRMMTFEKKNQERCHRVRYEDFVTAPEETAADIFSFLGVEQAPGITEVCFQIPHVGIGFGDKKIWFTGKVNANSLGRGTRVPNGLLAPWVREGVNEALTNLNYRTIDRLWNEFLGSIDPRADVIDSRADVGAGDLTADHPDQAGNQELDVVLGAIDERIRSWSPDELFLLGERWPFLAEMPIGIVVQDEAGDLRMMRWNSPSNGPAAEPPSTWHKGKQEDEHAGQIAVTADLPTWRSLLDGTANVASEVKANRLRYLHGRARGKKNRVEPWDALCAVAALLRLAPLTAPNPVLFKNEEGNP
jgi:hypothetical protein